MPLASLTIVLDGTIERSGPDFAVEDVLHLSDLALIGMPEGTQAGRPTVMMRFTLPDGRVVFAETTLRLLVSAVNALVTRYASDAAPIQ
jgi:hypothetical protein